MLEVCTSRGYYRLKYFTVESYRHQKREFADQRFYRSCLREMEALLGMGGRGAGGAVAVRLIAPCLAALTLTVFPVSFRLSAGQCESFKVIQTRTHVSATLQHAPKKERLLGILSSALRGFTTAVYPYRFKTRFYSTVSVHHDRTVKLYKNPNKSCTEPKMAEILSQTVDRSV